MISKEVAVKNGGFGECNDSSVKSDLVLHNSTSQKGLIDDKLPHAHVNDSAAFPKRPGFLKFGNLGSPSLKFQQITDYRDEISRSVPSSSSHNLSDRVHGLLTKKIDWTSLWNTWKEWIRNPLNIALFIWIVCVAISGAILFLVMTGMLNHVLPKKSQRNDWFEVNNQILNALFTLMCLYQHPKRFYHLVLISKWRPEDISKLRNIYCKNGTYKPHEWIHMMVVIMLLHINCFAQYALCGLNLGYTRSQRPPIGVAITISFAMGAPAAAGLYSILSPLGKDYDTEFDEEMQTTSTSHEKVFSFVSRTERVDLVTNPQWSGGIFNFWDDISLAYLSLFCSFCVFGWNMERLGFGNMYVHIATFLLFCMAPFWIFNLAAININNEAIRECLGITGIFLCVFGFLYGGFWRIQMRKRFNLPPYNFCCSKPALADFALWLCCCWCSLAQEVRTGNSYDIIEDNICRNQDIDIKTEIPISPLARENVEYSPSISSRVEDELIAPPEQLFITRESI